MLVASVVAFAAIAGSAGGAAAAAPWSVPHEASAAFERIHFDTSGPGSLVGIGSGPGAFRVSRLLAAPVQGGVPGQPRESTTSLNLIAMRPYGPDGVVAAGNVPSGTSARVALVRGRFGIPPSRPESLNGRSSSSQLLDLAVNQQGDAVAAVRWCLNIRCRRQTLEIFRWRADARITRPFRIARSRSALGAGVAINARGDVAILWDRRRDVRSGSQREVLGQILTVSGLLRPARRLGPVPTSPRYQVAMTNGRRVVAAWVAQTVSECFANRGEISVAHAGPGGRFGRARQLAALNVTGCGVYVTGPAVQFARRPDGRVLIAWSGNEGKRWVVRAAELGATGVQDTAVISDRASDAVLADLAVGSHGEAVILLADGIRGADPSGPPRLLAATRGAGAGAFSAPELVADNTGLGSTVAFDPATGRPAAAFTTNGQAVFRTSVVTRDPIGP